MPTYTFTTQESGFVTDSPFNVGEHVDNTIGPLEMERSDTPLESLFPEMPGGLKPPRISYVEHDHMGARVSQTYAEGPGLNAERYQRTNSMVTNIKGVSLVDEVERGRRAYSAPGVTEGVGMDSSMGTGTAKHFHADDTCKVPRFTRQSSSRALKTAPQLSKVSKFPKASKPRSLSPNQKFWGNGKNKLSKLRDVYPTHVRGVVEPSDYDKGMYSGVVNVDFRGRLDPLNAVGVNVAKGVPKGGGEGGMVIIPGKVVSQKSLKGRTTGTTYRLVFLNGTEETVNEIMLRHYSAAFASGCMSPDEPLLPLIVRMM